MGPPAPPPCFPVCCKCVLLASHSAPPALIVSRSLLLSCWGHFFYSHRSRGLMRWYLYLCLQRCHSRSKTWLFSKMSRFDTRWTGSHLHKSQMWFFLACLDPGVASQTPVLFTSAVVRGLDCPTCLQWPKVKKKLLASMLSSRITAQSSRPSCGIFLNNMFTITASEI